MNANVFDWDTVLEGSVHSDRTDYRWRRGEVHVVVATELPEMLIFIDRVLLSFILADEVRGLIALLKGEAESAMLSNDCEIRSGIGRTLSFGGDLDPVEIGLTDHEADSVIEGVTALLPYMVAGELWSDNDETDEELARESGEEADQ